MGWERVRVGKIAEAAGVSRPTIYAEFGNKEGLAQALITHEIDTFVAGIISRLERHKSNPTEALRYSIQYTLTAAKKSEIVRHALSGERGADALLQMLATRSEPMFYTATDTLVGWFTSTYPEISEQQARQPTDALVRLVASYVIFPGKPRRDLAEYLTEIALALFQVNLAQLERRGRFRTPRPKDKP